MAELKHPGGHRPVGPGPPCRGTGGTGRGGNDAALAMIHIANLAPLDQIRQLLSSEPERLEQDLVDQLRESLRTLGAVDSRTFRHHAGTAAWQPATLLPELLNHAATLPADLLVFGPGSSFCATSCSARRPSACSVRRASPCWSSNSRRTSPTANCSCRSIFGQLAARLKLAGPSRPGPTSAYSTSSKSLSKASCAMPVSMNQDRALPRHRPQPGLGEVTPAADQRRTG